MLPLGNPRHYGNPPRFCGRACPRDPGSIFSHRLNITVRLAHLDSEAAGAINSLPTVRIRVQQTDRVITKRDKGPVIHGTTLGETLFLVHGGKKRTGSYTQALRARGILGEDQVI